MAEDSYALVSYIPGKLGNFIDSLRRRFDPGLACWLAHVTLLSPRSLPEPLDTLLEAIRQQSASFEPFDVTISRVETFWPVSGVVYLGISEGAERLAQLHESLNAGPLAFAEPHPYVSHVTIAQQLSQIEKDAIMKEVREEWVRYGVETCFRVESLFLVKKTPENRWIDLAPIRLGERLAHFSI
ncbi:MAG: 2'-5' RNA ligase family protein [Acidobacteria bacterium]|nr:2'-5' RNA ligase family protein [Acidobacteriota bacterium]